MAEDDLEAGPRPRDAGIERRASRPQAEAEDPLEARAVHPAGRAGVPGPAAAPDVRRLGVDVGARRRRARPCSDGRRRACSAWWIGFRSENSSAALSPSPSMREGDHRPDRGVRVLAAVLADAGRIALDVARVERRAVEGRREEQRPVRRRGGRGARRPPPSRARARAGSAAPEITRPRLRDRVDPALVARRRAERRAVVEVAAPVPVAVPGVALERLRAARRRAAARPPRAPLRRAPRPAGAKADERGVQEPAEPDALALALRRRPGSCRRSSRRRRRAAGRGRRRRGAPSSARAQCSKSVACSLGDRGLEVRVVLAAARAAGPSRKGTRLVEHRRGRRSPRRSARRRRAARAGRRRCACARPRPDAGSHQCCTSPSANCRAAARSRCSRVELRLRRPRAPCRPGAGRGSRRRRSPGRRPSAPRPGRRASGRAASGSAGCRGTRSGVFTCTAPRTSSQRARHRAEAPRRDRRSGSARSARAPPPPSPPGRGGRRSRRARSAAARAGACSAPQGSRPRRPGSRAARRRASAAGSVERAVAAEELGAVAGPGDAAARRGPRTRPARRTRRSTDCARAALPSPRRSRSRRTAPRRRGRRPSTHST